MRALLLLLAFGAVIGTLLDAMHTFGGVTAYTHPFVLQTAWWVPFLFASAYGFGGFIYAVGYERLRPAAPIAPWNRLVIGVIVFAGLYAISAFAPVTNATKTALLLAGAIALWVWLDRSVAGIFLAGVAGFFGPLSEVLLSRAEVFRHVRPDLLGIPVWLPALYLATGPSFGQFARRLIRETNRASKPA